MQISLRWLKELVNLETISVETLITKLTLGGFEVEEVFEVPLSFFMNEDNHHPRSHNTPNGESTIYAKPYECPVKQNNYFIWGATAAMLRNLYHFLNAKV